MKTFNDNDLGTSWQDKVKIHVQYAGIFQEVFDTLDEVRRTGDERL